MVPYGRGKPLPYVPPKDRGRGGGRSGAGGVEPRPYGIPGGAVCGQSGSSAPYGGAQNPREVDTSRGPIFYFCGCFSKKIFNPFIRAALSRTSGRPEVAMLPITQPPRMRSGKPPPQSA